MIDKFLFKWNYSQDSFHFRVSVCKSTLRIVAGLLLASGSLLLAGLALIGAEVLGIVEEF